MIPTRSSLFLCGVAALICCVLIPARVFAAPTTVTKVQDLRFGSFAGGTGLAGTVSITPSGLRSSSGGVILIGAGFSPAQFNITGRAGASYTITIPSAITMTSGTDQISVTSIACSIPLTGVIPTTGTVTFTIGATANIGSLQRNSTYNGSLTVSVK